MTEENDESEEGSKNTRFVEYSNKSKKNDRKISQISDKLEKNSNSHFNVNGNESNNKTKSNKGHCYQRSQTLNNLSISENKKNYLEENIDDIIHKYDVFFLDQFGVLHNGKEPYEHVVKALNHLSRHNKIIVIISNSSSKSSIAKKRFASLSLPTCYQAFLTSGDLAWNYIQMNYKNKKC